MSQPGADVPQPEEPATGSELPRDLEDRIFRESLQQPMHLRSLLRQAVPDLADRFDCERLQPVGREFLSPSWHSRQADLPLEVPYQVGQQEVLALVFVLIEHQSATDPLLPLRMLYVVVCYWM